MYLIPKMCEFHTWCFDSVVSVFGALVLSFFCGQRHREIMYQVPGMTLLCYFLRYVPGVIHGMYLFYRLLR